MREESAQYPEGVVMEEFRRGFMLGDKLLRPAMVKVSSGLPSTPSEQSDAGEPELEDEVINK
jgi:molecular chaperone GrpE